MRIAIIGGGFTGAMVACNILELATDGTTLCVYEPAPDIGRGVAYADAPEHYLLNVPAAILATRPDAEGEFESWTLATLPRPERYREQNGSYFFPRSVFGDFVRARLADALRQRNEGVAFAHHRVVASSLLESDGRLAVVAGASVELYDKVVVAVGNAPPRLLPVERSDPAGPRVVQSAWRLAATAIDPDARIVIVGSGLTMADVVADLDTGGHRGPVVCVSRHGKRPHVSAGLLPAFSPSERRSVKSARQLVRQVRQWAMQSRADHGDWRPAIDFVRRNVTELWRDLPENEQRRLRRHARAMWEIHRFQMPPAAHRRIEELIAAGRFRHIKGSAKAVTGDGLRIESDGASAIIAADVVINAAGFDGSYRTAPARLDSLLGNLGVDLSDVEQRGLAVDDAGALLNLSAGLRGKLFAVGFLARANHGELVTANALASVAANLAGAIFRKDVAAR